jgi:hypothetical protein
LIKFILANMYYGPYQAYSGAMVLPDLIQKHSFVFM